MNPDWSFIAEQLSKATKTQLRLNNPQPIDGGCINSAWKISDQRQNSWFVKTNKPGRVEMFAAEFDGLQEIISSQTIKAPRPICYGQHGQFSFLVMEFLDLRGSPNGAETGVQLARMHRHCHDTFGWHRNNTIGSTPQINTQSASWSDFWQQHRLIYQLDLAVKKGFPHTDYDLGLRLAESVPQFFSDYQPLASLLHGDLWGGNCSADTHGNPVIYDPAVYYGDREADLAMTELFGGFGLSFRDAYHASFPIDPGYRTRKTLYNLYHILNHYNLFGGGYGTQAGNMIRTLLSELH